MRTSALAFATIAFAACSAFAADRQAAERHYEAGLRAEFAGSYESARTAFEKALAMAQANGLEQAFISAATYNLGRMTGYTCNFPKAKQLLLEALKMEQSLPAPGAANLTKRFSELARLAYDQGEFSEAVSYYERVVPEIERLGVLKLDPAGFAIFLDDYAASLTRAGNEQGAAAVARRAAEIKSEHAGVAAKFRPIYYRTTCPSR